MKKKKNLKLYDIPNESPLRVIANGKEDNAVFHHIDGMYSYCETSDGKAFHLHCGTPMKLVKGRYEIV